MGKTHKRVFLAALLAAATLAGTVSALSPAWERHRAEEKQEEALSNLEKEIDLQTRGTGLFKEPGEALQETAGTAVSAYAAPEPETKRLAKTAVQPGAEKEPERVMPQAGEEIGILSIPKIDARLPVTAGVSEEQLKISEGWVMQTAMIGSVGNAVIAGHRSYTYGKHFNRLGELETGDEIFYTAADGEEMCFSVSEILTVLPDDPAVFAAPSQGTAQLTLYTCTPVRVATHRLLVRAMLVED